MQTTPHSPSIAPAISVVMPTYNTPVPYLREAIESILNQTFRDFEFIVIDDGSTNGSDKYLKSLEDERIIIIWNQANLGVTKSLNIGLNAARGKYIARMDADDVSMPTRFEKQYSFMETHSDVVLLGTNYKNFTDSSASSSKPIVTKINSQTSWKIKSLFRYPGPVHPTIFIRRETLEARQLRYSPFFEHNQDYKLYLDISQFGKIAILSEILNKRRIHQQQITYQKRNTVREFAKKIQKELLVELLGSISDDELEFHYRFGSEEIKKGEIYRSFKWILKLVKHNLLKKKYNQKDFIFFTSKLFLSRFLIAYSEKSYNSFYALVHRKDKALEKKQ